MCYLLMCKHFDWHLPEGCLYSKQHHAELQGKKPTYCFSFPIYSSDNLNSAAVHESQGWKSQPDMAIDGIPQKAFWLHSAATTREFSQKQSWWAWMLIRISQKLAASHSLVNKDALNTRTATQDGENWFTNLITTTTIFPALSVLVSHSSGCNNFSLL